MSAPPLDAGVGVLAETALADRIRRGKPVIVLFYADWCPFCARFLPIFRRHAKTMPVETLAANISHPDDPRWDTYRVDAVPTFIAFRDGNEVLRADARKGVGLTEADLVAFIEAAKEAFA